MRQRFEQQMTLNTVAIADVEIPLKSRDELPPIVQALKYIFITPELNEKVFELLEKRICSGKKKTGRKGMDLWHILVLAVVRHATNANWDTLHTWSNYHELVRLVMGVHSIGFKDIRTEFNYQSILDNVSLLDEAVLREINQIVVATGHQLLKKKEDQALSLKTDSYVLETNIHFPTDLNLLWDSSRKCLDMIEKLKLLTRLKGWRKTGHNRSTLKSLFRRTSQQVFKGKSEAHKKQMVCQYLEQAEVLSQRCRELIKNPPVSVGNEMQVTAILVALKHYLDYADKFIDQIERRLIKGEVIPASEKVYSIFEAHTEWITKGKLNKKVELGHLLLITTDQYQFIVDYKVMEGQKDQSQISSLLERLKKTLGTTPICSHSFDKGFYSKENLQTLMGSGTEQVILPKKGKHNKEDKEREGKWSFKELRKDHSAIESNINSLEHHGLNRCMDKGLRGYKRCVGLSVLAYNLHVLGNALQAAERIKEARKEKRRLRLAA